METVPPVCSDVAELGLGYASKGKLGYHFFKNEAKSNTFLLGGKAIAIKEHAHKPMVEKEVKLLD